MRLGLYALLVGGLVVFDALVVSVVYHRYLSHRALDVNHWVARIATLVIQGLAFAPPLTWVSAHRWHHGQTDLPDDPYSPTVHGFWRVLFFTPFLVSQWRRRYGPRLVPRLTAGLPDRRFYTFCDSGWFCLVVTLATAAIFYAWLGRLGLVVYGLQLLGFHLVGGWINAGGHSLGERPHPNTGANCRGVPATLLNLGMAGEWLHNHHHHAPGSPNFGLGGELDSGYLACRLLAACGLARMGSEPVAVRLAREA